MANLLNRLAETQLDIAESLESTHSSWADFDQNCLKPFNDTENIKLGGVQPSHPSLQISDEDDNSAFIFPPSGKYTSHNKDAEDLAEPE